MKKRSSTVAALAIVSILLFSAPSAQAGSFTTNLKKGWSHYVTTVKGWFTGLGGLLTGKKAAMSSAGGPCEEQSDCSQGLSCLNSCDVGECDVFAKRCAVGPSEIKILPAWAPCGKGAACAKGTACTRTCPKGVSCDVSYRCVMAAEKGPSSPTVAACVNFCHGKALPPIGFSAFRPVIGENGCVCALEEVQPDLKREACPEALDFGVPEKGDPGPIVCAVGTTPGCTSEKGPLRLTCLKAPEFGGQCLTDAACRDVNCPVGTSPFCDKDRLCRCRGQKEDILRCSKDADCASVRCDQGEVKVCSNGVCACGKTTVTEQEIACAVASDCPSNCASGYQRACVQGRCACQRTVESGPVSCKSVNDCGAVGCPAGYEKACTNSQCVCTRQVTQ